MPRFSPPTMDLVNKMPIDAMDVIKQMDGPMRVMLVKELDKLIDHAAFLSAAARSHGDLPKTTGILDRLRQFSRFARLVRTVQGFDEA